ncbi:Uncharacterised protein [Mycobacteroides abscessus]|nr:Uncharacterised protein [Mycobacteroides abscessus]SLD49876.1 Uncharacterised protein [Mycobacteroides abscessus subsp. massiliense]
MKPVSEPMPTMSRVEKPTMPTEAPTAMPMKTNTPMTPPPTMIEPLPHVMSTSRIPV